MTCLGLETLDSSGIEVLHSSGVRVLHSSGLPCGSDLAQGLLQHVLIGVIMVSLNKSTKRRLKLKSEVEVQDPGCVVVSVRVFLGILA